jgi:hypothetical protein
MKHRREFIKTSCAAALALGVAPGALAARPRRIGARRPIVPLSDLHHADFAELVDTAFLVSASSGVRVPLVLAEAEDLSTRFGGENFSVVFHGPSGRPLSQGTYPFEHRALGSFGLFIVPLRGDGRSARYQAIFNRIA